MVDKIIVPRRMQDWFTDGGDLTLRALRFFESITNQTNTTVIDVIDIEFKAFVIVNTTESLTTTRNQIIICKNTVPINITLNPDAVIFEEVHIKRRGAEVNVIGTIDGLTDITLNIESWSTHLVFDGLDWSVI